MAKVFDDNENVLFKHKSTFGGKDGEILASNVRLFWVPISPSDASLDIPWANIASVKYSPANDPKDRVMVMVQTVTTSEKPKVLHLVGPSIPSCKSELERLKGLYADLHLILPNIDFVYPASFLTIWCIFRRHNITS
jgi:hypothetical protein